MPLTAAFYKLQISPNTVSISMIFLSVMSIIILNINESQSTFYTALFVSYLSFLLDKVDGDLARLYKTTEFRSVIIDFTYHRITNNIFLYFAFHFVFTGVNHSNFLIFLWIFLINFSEDLFLIQLAAPTLKKINIPTSLDITNIGNSFYQRMQVLKFFNKHIFILYYLLAIKACEFYIDFDYIFMTLFLFLPIVSLVIYCTWYVVYCWKYEPFWRSIPVTTKVDESNG